MATLLARIAAPIAGALVRPALRPGTPVERRRGRYSWILERQLRPRGVTYRAARLGGLPTLVAEPAVTEPGRALLYLHGGGYVIGSPKTAAALAGRLARAARATAWCVAYRLAPEHPFPAALDDATTAYEALVAAHDPAAVAVAGDSAGGGLALALLHTLRDHGLALPSCGVLLCPWLDLTMSDPAVRAAAVGEPILNLEGTFESAGLYAGGRDLADPGLSPLFGDHRGLPPLLVQTAARDLLATDGLRFAAAGRAAGVDVTLDAWDGVFHAWQAAGPAVPEARRALATAGAFIDAHC